MSANPFVRALVSNGSAPDRGQQMKLYGWLIGSWTMDAIRYFDDGTQHKGSGEIHFGWVLEGRAIQDVWILPGIFYGTTLRVYDPGIDAWHILWSDPLHQVYTRQIGRARGADIVQDGKNDAGESVRWSFTEITTDSFHWIGERSRDGGKTWQLQADIFARRDSSSRPFFEEPTQMIDHVSIGVRDIARAKRFYDAALSPLGYTCLSEIEGTLGYGGHAVAFWISRVENPVSSDMRSGLHFCFTAPTPESVNAFHRAALDAGGRDNGRPGRRADYGPGYYAAFAIDPDGYRIEAHCEAPPG